MNLDNFLEKLPLDELRRLQAKIDLKLSDKDKPKESTETSEDDFQVYSALSRVVTMRGIRPIPWKQFSTTNDAKNFRAKAPWLAKFVKKGFQPKTKIELDYCYLLSFKLLVEWMERLNIPISYRTCVNNCDRIPILIDDAFPGYRQAGLLNALIKKARDARKTE